MVVFKNLMEDYVLSILDHMIKNLDCCKCEKCRLDIASYALNRLPSKYVATTQGELMTKVFELNSSQFETQVMATITSAALVVKQHPRHVE